MCFENFYQKFKNNENANYFLISLCNTLITKAETRRKKDKIESTHQWLIEERSQKARYNHPDIIRISEFQRAACSIDSYEELKQWAIAEKNRIENEKGRIVKTWEQDQAEREALEKKQ